MSIKHVLCHLTLSLLIISIFIFSCKWVLRDWVSVERVALDRLRPETFRHLCQNTAPNFLRLYDVYFNRVEKLMGEKYPEIYSLLGYLSFQKGKLEAAAAYYKTAIKHNPGFALYYYNLGVIYYWQGYYGESIELLQHAANLDIKDSLETIISSSRLYLPMVVDCVGGVKNIPNYLQFVQLEAIGLSSFLQKRIRGEQVPPLRQEPNLACF